MSPNPQFPLDLVTFTEDIRNGKLLFWGSAGIKVLIFQSFQPVFQILMFLEILLLFKPC